MPTSRDADFATGALRISSPCGDSEGKISLLSRSKRRKCEISPTVTTECLDLRRPHGTPRVGYAADIRHGATPRCPQR